MSSFALNIKRRLFNTSDVSRNLKWLVYDRDVKWLIFMTVCGLRVKLVHIFYVHRRQSTRFNRQTKLFALYYLLQDREGLCLLSKPPAKVS